MACFIFRIEESKSTLMYLERFPRSKPSARMLEGFQQKYKLVPISHSNYSALCSMLRDPVIQCGLTWSTEMYGRYLWRFYDAMKCGMDH